LTARIIFSLSALAASLFAGSGQPSMERAHDSAPGLLRPRLLRPHFLRFGAPFILTDSAQASPSSSLIPTPAAALSLAALSATPFRSSICLVASFVAIDLIERRHQREFLRC
jgi:hypothetical protein